MSSVILEAHDLTKEYRHTVALDHIDLKIEKGKIYGFIGQNGAGKTTFLRLVTGLAFPTSGTLSLWGKTVEKELQEQRKRIGCMIETPALFPTMTAYQNMEIQRIQRGIPDKAVIQKTLDMVGLKDTGKKAVRNFSLGMRQRLGIAIALLNTPEFLILDEPINGLDPAGIVEIRNLLKSLNKEYGMTILVSSHILEELYQTASEFILIDKGKIIEEISDRELNDRCKRHIAIKATDPQKALIVLEETLHTDSFKLMPDGMIRLYDYLDDSCMLECGFCGGTLTRRSWHSGSQYNKVIWQCVTATKKGKKFCPDSKGIAEETIEQAFIESYRLLCQNNKDVLDEFIARTEETLSDSNASKQLAKVEKDIAALDAKRAKLVDMRLEEIIDKETYEQKYFDLSSQIEQLQKQRESLQESAETESTMKKRIAEFRRTLEENEVLDTFDRYVFESIVEKVIVGGYDEDGNKDPAMLTFIYKTGFKNSLDGTNFKPPRKNSKAAKQNAGLCSHTTDEAKSMCSYHSDDTSCRTKNIAAMY